MLKWLRKRFSDAETQRLAEEVERAADQLSVLGHKVEGLELRLQRHLNKLQMREGRAKRANSPQGELLSEEEAAIIDDLRRRGDDGPSSPPYRDPFYQ